MNGQINEQTNEQINGQINGHNYPEFQNRYKLKYLRETFKHTLISYLIMVFSTGIGSFILTKSKYFLIRSPTLSSFLYISLIIYPFYKIITLDSKENERSISVVRDRVYIDNSSDNRRNSIYKIMATLGLINSPLAIIIHKIYIHQLGPIKQPLFFLAVMIFLY